MRSFGHIAAALALAPAFAPACEGAELSVGTEMDGSSASGMDGGSGPNSGDAHASCMTNAECPQGDFCGYPLPAFPAATGCGEQAVCVPIDKGPLCDTLVAGCGCNGQTTDIPACGEAYVGLEFSYYGQCEGGSVPPTIDAAPPTDAMMGTPPDEGGPSPVAMPCTSDSQCLSNQYCGYPLPAHGPTGCTEQGTCVATDIVSCQILVAVCGCNGKTTSVAGCGEAYVPTLFAYYGNCE